MKTIPNELGLRFTTEEGRKEMIELYGDSQSLYSGVNEDGENVIISIDKDTGIILKTNQANGWVRVNYYDKDGVAEGEGFDGRWR